MPENQPSFEIHATCPICSLKLTFTSPDDHWSCRDSLRAAQCPHGKCVTRERALAKAVLSCYSLAQLAELDIHEAAPVPRGLSLVLKEKSKRYITSGYFPEQPFGTMVGRLRNEDLEQQTFADSSFDLVLHLDVLEHLFHPFMALREIRRTLRPRGRCIFTAPSYWDRAKSQQVAEKTVTGEVRITGTPEFHGNPQDPERGALVTWKYGYDLPLLIRRETGFDVEVRRWQSPSEAILGPMTEVYILTK